MSVGGGESVHDDSELTNDDGRGVVYDDWSGLLSSIDDWQRGAG